MASIKASNKSQEKKDESLVEKLNDSNSKSLLRNSREDSFKISLFPKPNNRRTKIGGDLTAAFTAKFNQNNKNSLKRKRTLTFNENNEKNLTSNASETETSLKDLEYKFSKKKELLLMNLLNLKIQ